MKETMTMEAEEETAPTQQMKRKPRGFATFSPEKKRYVAHLGGMAVQKSGKAHHWTPEEAQEAGRRGGQVSTRRGVSNGEGRKEKPKQG